MTSLYSADNLPTGSPTSPYPWPTFATPASTFDSLRLRGTTKEAKQWLLNVIAKGSSVDGGQDEPSNEYFAWFCKFLEARFQSVKDSHFNPCTSEVSKEKIMDQVLDLCAMYNMMAAIASQVDTTPSVTLLSLVDGLVHVKIFKREDEARTNLMNQLVFMAVGWLSMLYDPDRSPASGKLQIVNDTMGTGRRLRASKIQRFQQDFNQASQPFPTLLRVFGAIIPRITPPSDMEMHRLRDREFLTVSYLSYHTLSRVCKLNIEWVDTLSFHLDFVEQRRTLKLFAFPSFCYMMYTAESEDPMLCSLFGVARAPQVRAPDDSSASFHNQDVRDYFREILLSYRLVFGQDKRSWRAFKRAFATNGRSRADGEKSPHFGRVKRQNTAIKTRDAAVDDPLLARLCGHSWKTEEDLYKSLDADEAPNHYSPAMDFPILSDKLLRLQRFSKEQHPHDWKLLWTDRRDIRLFYTFWAVLAIGCATIVVALVQAGLTAWQIYVGYLANWLAAEQNRLQALQLEQGPQRF